MVFNDTDTGIGIGDTGISLPTLIPIRGIADMTILKKDNYYAFGFTTAEAIVTPYLEVKEHTKHYLQSTYVNVCIMLVLCLHIITHYDQYNVLFLRNKGKTFICCVD